MSQRTVSKWLLIGVPAAFLAITMLYKWYNKHNTAVTTTDADIIEAKASKQKIQNKSISIQKIKKKDNAKLSKPNTTTFEIRPKKKIIQNAPLSQLPSFDKFDPKSSSNDIKITTNDLMITSPKSFQGGYSQYAVGTYIAHPNGVYLWKIKLSQLTGSTQLNIEKQVIIGIINAEFDTELDFNKNSFIKWKQYEHVYGYQTNGIFYPNSSHKKHFTANNGDVIGVCLDLKENILTFTKKQYCHKIKVKGNMKYRLIVQLSSSDHMVELIYSKIIHDQQVSVQKKDDNNLSLNAMIRIVIAQWIRLLLQTQYRFDDVISIMIKYADVGDRFGDLSSDLMSTDKERLILKRMTQQRRRRRNNDQVIHWESGFGTFEAISGAIYEWKIKLIQGHNMIIGIIGDGNNDWNGLSERWWDAQPGYAYYTFGMFYPGMILKKEFECKKKGDIVGIRLDLSENGKRYIEYNKNNKHRYIQMIEEKSKRFKLGVAIVASNTPAIVEVVSFEFQE